jgi:hypothetical protein
MMCVFPYYGDVSPRSNTSGHGDNSSCVAQSIVPEYMAMTQAQHRLRVAQCAHWQALTGPSRTG